MSRSGGDSSRSSNPPPTGAAATADASLSPALEQARPSDRDEEDLQLELALAISKEEAEKDREEDEALKATLERSKTETRIEYSSAAAPPEPPKPTLLSISKQPPPRPPSTPLDPWGLPLMPGSSSAVPTTTSKPPAQVASLPANDPWAPAPQTSEPSLLDTSLNAGVSQPANYAVINTSAKPSQPAPVDLIDPWGGPLPGSSVSALQPATTGILLPQSSTAQPSGASNNLLGDLDPFGSSLLSSTPPLTTPQIPPHVPMSSSTTLPPSSKMGTILDNRTKHLVNIDNLISTQTPNSGSTNPFGNPRPAPGSVFSGESTNPFLTNVNNAPNLSLNELRSPPPATANTNPFA